MPALKARVENGRLKLDEPTDLPDGTAVPLEVANDWEIHRLRFAFDGASQAPGST